MEIPNCYQSKLSRPAVIAVGFSFDRCCCVVIRSFVSIYGSFMKLHVVFELRMLSQPENSARGDA